MIEKKIKRQRWRERVKDIVERGREIKKKDR